MLAAGDERRAALEAAWTQVQRHGWLGDAPVSDHVDHALTMLEWAGLWVPAWDGCQVADIGSGAGVPGLVWALVLPSSTTVHLIERSRRRAAFLRLMTARLHPTAAVAVWDEPAEATELGGAAGAVDLVVARSFGPPPAVVEAAAHLLGPAGRLVVSDAPGDGDDRWRTAAVRERGFAPVGRRAEPPSMVALARVVEAGG